MLQQYIFIVLSTIVRRIGDMIDTGFGNSISIEAICILGIIPSVRGILDSFSRYGSYYYQYKGDRVKAGFYLTLVVSSVITALMFLLADHVKYIWKIDPAYAHTLGVCIRLAFVAYVPYAVGVNIRMYLLLSCHEKLCTISHTCYYLLMILLDAVAVLKFHSIELVIISTGICDLLYAIIMYFAAGMHKQKYVKGDLRIVIKDGFVIVVNRIISELCCMLIEVMATHFGTMSLAVVVITRKALVFGQTFIAAIHTQALNIFRDIKVSISSMFCKMRRIVIVAISSCILSGFICMLSIRGDVPLSELLLPCMLSVVTSAITYTAYVFVYAKAMVDGSNKELNYQALLRFLSTMVLCLLSAIPALGIYPLLMYSTFTDGVIAVLSYISITRRSSQERKIHTDHE